MHGRFDDIAFIFLIQVMHHRFLWLGACLVLGIASSSGQTETNSPTANPIPPQEPGATASPISPAPASASPPATSSDTTAGYDGKAVDPNSPITIRIISPKPDEIVSDNTVDIFFEVHNYALADQGNCLHIIVNNQPPVAYYNTSAPFTLRGLTEGGHTIRVFAAKPDGRMLEDLTAFASVHFFVRKKNFQNFVPAEAPLLTVNMPADGVVDVEPNGRVWFDFRTDNAPLSKDTFSVRYVINNMEAFATDNKPIYWEGLKPGRYDFTAELVDATGQQQTGLFNQVKRTFQVRWPRKAMASETTAPPAPVTPPVAPPQHSPNILRAIPVKPYSDSSD